MKSKAKLRLNILRITMLSITVLILIIFCLAVMAISAANSANKSTVRSPQPGPVQSQGIPSPQNNSHLLGFTPEVDEMLITPGFWIKFINERIAGENAEVENTHKVAVDQMTKDDHYWLKEISKNIQSEDLSNTQTILRDI